jgi:hypothetical protein
MTIESFNTYIEDAAEIARIAMRRGLPMRNILHYRRHAREWIDLLNVSRYQRLNDGRRREVATGLVNAAYVMLSDHEEMSTESFSIFIEDVTEVARIAIKRGPPEKDVLKELQTYAEEWMELLSETRYETLDREQRQRVAADLAGTVFNLVLKYSESVKSGAWPPSP